MANLSKFHVVFSSSTLIRLDMDAFEGHLCQTVNNFVKQYKSSLLSPLRKRRPPQHIKHITNTRVSRIQITFDEISRIFSFFHVSALNHYTNLCLRVYIYMRSIDNFLNKLNAYNSTSCAVNCGISQ